MKSIICFFLVAALSCTSAFATQASEMKNIGKNCGPNTQCLSGLQCNGVCASRP